MTDSRLKILKFGIKCDTRRGLAESELPVKLTFRLQIIGLRRLQRHEYVAAYFNSARSLC